MAADERKRQRNEINYRGGMAENQLNDLKSGFLTPLSQNMFNNYQTAVPRQMEDYGRIMGQYQNFADTGGYSPNDLGAIRSRALSPTRAVYSNAQRNVNRQKAVQGGYSPGFGTLQARMAREQGQGISDAATNAEAAIAQMVNQGKQFGTQGAASLYGTTPGMAATFGNQVLGVGNQLLDAQNMQNQLQLGLIGAHQGAQQVPGKWDNTMGKIGDIAGMATSFINPFLSGQGTRQLLPSRNIRGGINSGMYNLPGR